MSSTKIRILILGDYSVGKTSLILRYIDKYTEFTMSTIGIDYYTKLLLIDKNYCTVEVWDTAGQERFRTIPKNYYKSSDGIILVFDTSSRKTFENIKNWAKNISDFSAKNIVCILVGNKIDNYDRQVSKEEAEMLSQEISMKYFEASAKENINVASTFENFAYELYKIKKKQDKSIEVLTLSKKSSFCKEKKCSCHK